MQFGKTYEEQKNENKKLRSYNKFAFFPILLNNGKYAWLETIFARETYDSYDARKYTIYSSLENLI